MKKELTINSTPKKRKNTQSRVGAVWEEIKLGKACLQLALNSQFSCLLL
jgi:hypothetical protein